MKFIRFWRVFLAIWAVTVCIAPCAWGKENTPLTRPQLDRLLDEAESNFNRVSTVKTRFTQEKNLSLFSEKMISKGFCIFKAPQKLRLEYESPFKSSLIINEDEIYKYEFYDGQWQKLNPGDKELMLMIMKNITSWLNGKFRDPEVYDISAVQKDRQTIISLVPKHHEFQKFIQSFELALNSRLNGLNYIIINESKNDATKIIFHDDVVNQNVSDMVFDGQDNAPRAVEPW